MLKLTLTKRLINAIEVQFIISSCYWTSLHSTNIVVKIILTNETFSFHVNQRSPDDLFYFLFLNFVNIFFCWKIGINSDESETIFHLKVGAKLQGVKMTWQHHYFIFFTQTDRYIS